MRFLASSYPDSADSDVSEELFAACRDAGFSPERSVMLSDCCCHICSCPYCSAGNAPKDAVFSAACRFCQMNRSGKARRREDLGSHGQIRTGGISVRD